MKKMAKIVSLMMSYSQDKTDWSASCIGSMIEQGRVFTLVWKQLLHVFLGELPTYPELMPKEEAFRPEKRGWT